MSRPPADDRSMRKWLIARLAGETEPRARLVVFPHAGAGPSRYASWCRRLPAYCERLAVCLPGREQARACPPLTTLQEAAACAADAITDIGAQDHGRVPLVLYGHSMGAILCVETARQLPIGLEPAAVVVSGSRSPAAAKLSEPLHELQTPELLRRLADIGSATAAVTRSPGFLAYWEPIIRADLKLCHDYDADEPPYVSCPLVAVAGRYDRHADADQMRDWERYTTGPFTLDNADGGHFHPLEGDGNPACRWVARAVDHVATGAAAAERLAVGPSAPGPSAGSRSQPWHGSAPDEDERR